MARRGLRLVAFLLLVVALGFLPMAYGWRAIVWWAIWSLMVFVVLLWGLVDALPFVGGVVWG